MFTIPKDISIIQGNIWVHIYFVHSYISSFFYTNVCNAVFIQTITIFLDVIDKSNLSIVTLMYLENSNNRIIWKYHTLDNINVF